MGNADVGSVMMLSKDRDEMQFGKYDAPLLFFPSPLVFSGKRLLGMEVVS
jgi:hypothetical protein